MCLGALEVRCESGCTFAFDLRKDGLQSPSASILEFLAWLSQAPMVHIRAEELCMVWSSLCEMLAFTVMMTVVAVAVAVFMDELLMAAVLMKSLPNP